VSGLDRAVQALPGAAVLSFAPGAVGAEGVDRWQQHEGGTG
jgi:hypothetical protein